MTTHTISMDLINSPHAEEYFLRGDRRIMTGFRATLELLRLPLPDYAKRADPGPKRRAAEAVAKAYAMDNPAPRPTVLAARKPNATADVVAATIAKRSSLYDETFG